MGECQPPTAADYAWETANRAQQKANSLEERITRLEAAVMQLARMHDSLVKQLQDADS